MTEFGFHASHEQIHPSELLAAVVHAERAGFDAAMCSDHFSPWSARQGHSGFAWSWLGAALQATSLPFGVVNAPGQRYHPAIIAQAAATMALISDGRFTLGVGAGERLNEHVVGQGFPSVRGRHERLREALEIIRLLWRGGYQSYEGRHLQLEDARVWDLPDTPPVIAVAASGQDSAALAADLGDGLFATEPKSSIVGHYRDAGGTGPRYAEVPLAWATDEEQAVRAAKETSRWAVTGWKVMSELPNPANFDAATAWVEDHHIRQQFSVGPDPAVHLAKARAYVEAGYDHIVLQNAGPDPDGFLDFFAAELAAPLRAMG